MNRPPHRPRSRVRPLACCLVVALGQPVVAGTVALPPGPDGRRDFERQAQAAVPGAGWSYPYLRCSALYRALRLAARPESGAPRAALQRPTPPERALIDEAVRARVEQTGRPRLQVGPQVEADIADLARLYAARFETRAERAPDRWWDDPLVETDLRACGLLLQSLGAVGEAPREAADPAVPAPAAPAAPSAGRQEGVER